MRGRRLGWVAGACAAAALLVIGGTAGEAQGRRVVLSVVGTNDLHGGVVRRGDGGGLAIFGGYLANLRASRRRDGGGLLLLDAGDMFQGTLESNLLEGAPVVDAYNALGYAAAAVGNHEFDFGPEGPDQYPAHPGEDPVGALKARAAQARFPFLAANLIDASTGRPVDWPNVRPSVMVRIAGVRVGIIGLLTRTALAQTMAANVRGLRVAPLADTIRKEASDLRAAGATVVVVTAHAGGRCTSFDAPEDLGSCDPRSEIIDVVRALPDGLIDVVVAGHTHAGMAHEVDRVPVIESYSSGRAFGRVDLVIDGASGRVVDRRLFPPRDLCARVDRGRLTCSPDAPSMGRVPATYEGRAVTPDPAIERILAPALANAAARKARPLGVQVETAIRRGSAPESPLGNLFADAFRQSVPGADVALNNTFGGLRSDLRPGPLTYGALYEVFPFDNRLFRITLTGRELKRVAAVQLTRQRLPAGISGFRVVARCAGGELDVTLLRPDGTPIRDDERLAVATTDFIATGGDAILTPVMPRQGFAVPERAPLARDAVAAQLEKRGGSIRSADLVDTRHPRWTVPGGLPLTCGAE
jgi:5'-nucleotidase